MEIMIKIWQGKTLYGFDCVWIYLLLLMEIKASNLLSRSEGQNLKLIIKLPVSFFHLDFKKLFKLLLSFRVFARKAKMKTFYKFFD